MIHVVWPDQKPVRRDGSTLHSAATHVLMPRTGAYPTFWGKGLMLGEEDDYVIGVDTHKDSHSAAVVNAAGGVVAGVEVAASDSG